MDLLILGEIGIVIFAWLLFPNRLAPINLFLLSIGLLTIYFIQPYTSPFVSQKAYRETAIQQIEQIEIFLPVASSLKKVKPTAYQELINDIALNHAITEELTADQRIFIDYKIILRLFGRFFQSAFDVDVSRYIQAHLRFIRELKQIDPDSVSKFHYPHQFGLLEFDTLLKNQSRFEYHKAVEAIIESGKSLFGYPPPNNGAHFYKKFIISFRLNHPAEASVLEAAYTAQTTEHRRFLAEALVLFYSEVANLPQKEACDIWRQMLSNY